MMCGYFCVEFINFMFKSKFFLDYTNLFSAKEYQKNDKMMLKYESKKIPKFSKKTLVLSIICIKCSNEDQKVYKQ